MNQVLNIFIISLLAGLATGLGGLIVLIKKPGKRLFGFLMGFATGVMIAVSFLDLLKEAIESSGYLFTAIGFAVGALFMALVDSFSPHIHFGEKENISKSKFLKSGMLIALGITIHNIPEGISVGAGYMHLPEFGIFIAIAIALHNIPEGIATALPLCKSELCKAKIFLITLFSGLVEPIGALIAVFFLTPFKNLIPISLAFAAGVMIFITFDELIPLSRDNGHHHSTIIGMMIGILFVFLFSALLT